MRPLTLRLALRLTGRVRARAAVSLGAASMTAPARTGSTAPAPAALGASSVGGQPRVTWADAFTLIATRSMHAAATPARRSRYRVNVFLDTDGGWLTGTPRLPRHLIDGLTCEGTLTPVWTTNGHPVNVGDTQRVVPNRSRVLVLDRDRGCRFPGCGAGSYLEVHHLRHWRDGGPTDLPNLLSLCPHHHDGHHRGDYTITGDPTRPDGLHFHTRTGLRISPPGHSPGREPDRTPGPAPEGLTTTHPRQEQPPPFDPPRPDRRDPAGLRLLPLHTEHHATMPTDTITNDDPSLGARGDLHSSAGPSRADRTRPRPRLGRTYPAPTGGTLHLSLVDFTPPRQRRDQ
ncbi:HNH endonuclease signature motif containing protein [Monashia sp. NPDC004114]